jgi:small subunit ribosomal protein S4
VRLSHVLGLVLTPKCCWYLRRRNRRRRRHPRRDTASRIMQRLPVGQWRRVRAEYQLRGRQVRRVLDEATRQPGDTGETLVELLEQRLDVLVWRAGFARSPRRARELIAHNHIAVDGAIADLPSYRLRAGQSVHVRDVRRDRPQMALAAGSLNAPPPPPYLDVQPAQLRATLTHEPRKQEIPVLREEHIVVEPSASRPAR